jgi:2-dehydro-3-deoxyphosphogluconate aldolase/(4S)-4-hydroxy-2-oxoglutarate aldolase
MLAQILKRPIIPVIVLEDAAVAEPLAEAFLSAGLDVIEITFRTPAAAAAIERIRKAFPEMLVGAGTLVTLAQAQRAIDVGVNFGLAPGLNPATVEFFQKKNILFIPGVMTPSEIEQGLSLGCRLLKFFPAGPAGGPAMLTALGGPYASLGVKFCPTGGVKLENMMDYLSLPLVSNIGGTWLATKQQLENKDWETITDQVKAALARLV